MTRPTALSIFGKPFTVSYIEGLEDEEGGLLGRNETDGQEINVREGLKIATEQDTLLHETIHCIEEMMDLDLTERQVSCLGMGLVALFRDNPSLVGYLSRKF